MQFSTLAFNRTSVMAAMASQQATNLQQSYQQALTAQQASAPALNTLVNGPGVYAGADGKSYLVPGARLGKRANRPQTWDIVFTSNGGSWNLIATIELFRPAGADANAIPLLMDSYQVAIDPRDATPGFTFTKVTPFNAPDGSTDVIGLLKAEGVIDENIALTLLSAKPNSQIIVTGGLTYRHTYTRTINPPVPPTPPPPPPKPPVKPPPRVFGTRNTLMPMAQREVMMSTSAFQVAAPHPITQTITEGVTGRQTLGAIAAHFDKDGVDNKAIYAGITGSDSDGSVWGQQTGQGYSRPSSGSYAYYVLPDSYRLALDANTGLPAMSLLLIETPPATPGGDTTFSLRIRFAIAPVLDGGRLEKMRESLSASQRIPYPQLAIGGYTSASFVLSAIFSELPGFHSSLLAADAAAWSRCRQRFRTGA